jgi:glycosyltransferase involved in cell wall biosynthesis
VLLLTSNFPRWSGDTTTPFVLNLAADLQGHGWQVEVVAPHAPGAKRNESLGGVQIRRFRYMLPESKQTVAYEGGALINLRRNKANWLKVPFLVLAELVTTVRLLITRRYALVNAHWILPQGFVGALAGGLTRTPLVTTVHGGDVFDLQGKSLVRFKGWALHRSQVVTVNSSATEAAVYKLAPSADIRRIPMGVDVSPPDAEHASALRLRHRNGDGPLVVFVGRLVLEKGVDDLIRAIAILREELPETTALIGGTGQDEPELVRLRDHLGIGDCVTFTGWIEPEEVRAYLAAADVFAGPSKQAESGWREGLGLVFLEAMAAGTPVVATASGGITDIVRDVETGLLVAEGAPDEIANAIARIHNDPPLRKRLVDNGRNQVIESFSRDSSAASFAKLFSEITAGRRLV